MLKARVARTILGCLLIGAAVVWCIGFPKRADLRPDMAFSVALGVGLAVTGVLCLLITKQRAAAVTLSTLLLWSVLFNLVSFAHIRAFREIVAETPAREARAAQYYLSILDSDREDATEHLIQTLKDSIKLGEDMSAALKR